MSIFLVDESIGRSVHRALLEAGESSETIIDRHGRGAHDETWLPDAGQHRLIVLTADDRLRTRPVQKQMILEHKVLYFCLAPDHVFSLAEKVRAVLAAVPEMKRLAALPSSRSGIAARIHPDGRVTRLDLT